MKINVALKQFALSIVCVSIFAAIVGCGGTSQDDMRRYAMRRAPDPEDEDTASIDTAKNTPAEDDRPTDNSNSKQDAKDAATKKEASTKKPEENKVKDAVVDEPAASVATAPTSLTPNERKQLAAANLTKIGEAWGKYVAENKTYPPRTKAFSWRVSLLPYLGYESLYNKFQLDELWNSTDNIKLLSKIPPIYKSLNLGDSRTNILAIDGPQSLLSLSRPMRPSEVKDGAANTLALVEVDDEHAVPWTKPVDLVVDATKPLDKFGNLHEDGFFVLWADGHAGWIDNVVHQQDLIKAYSVNSADGFVSASISYPPEGAWLVGDERPQLATASVTTEEESGDDSPAGTTSAPDASPNPMTLQEIAAAHAAEQTERGFESLMPVPKGPELRKARDLIKELYGTQYASAKSDTERIELVRSMLADLSRVANDIPGQYALLDVARQVATQLGQVDLALQATDYLVLRFDLGESDATLETFEQLARAAKDESQVRQLISEAMLVYDEFVYHQSFASAARICRLSLAAANKLNDQKLVDKLSQQRRWSEAASEAYREAESGFKVLETNPNDETANAAVGKFLCFFRDDWLNGIPILANGNDLSLKRLASLEVSTPADGNAQMELADLWWKESEKSSSVSKIPMQQRASFWYQRALPNLPAGLVKIRVERRIAEIQAGLAKAS